MPSFDNTEIAYKHLTNRQLKKAYVLFKLMSSPTLVKAGKYFIMFCIKLHIPISWFLKPTIYKHFCGGEHLKEASKTIDILKDSNVKAILDYSVEGEENEKSFQKALDETLKTIEFARKNPHVPFAVFKPSGFGRRKILEKASTSEQLTPDETKELDAFIQRIDILCKSAFDANVPIMIDAEHTYYQNIIDLVCEQMMGKYNKEKAIVFNTLQMYRTDRIDYLNKIFTQAKENNYFIGVKLVRGAYMEKERERALRLGYESPIYPDKQATDLAYNNALIFSICNIDRICVFNGSHNEESNRLLTDLVNKAGLSKDDSRVWFSQLYGMSDNISFNLAYRGFNVAKYIPYGPVKHVIPYLIRRAEENTSVNGQTSRELYYIVSEINRRKGKYYNHDYR